MADARDEVERTAIRVIGGVLFDVGRRAVQFSRKRGPDDGDHWYPLVPEYWGLKPHQCFWCWDVLPHQPKRGCEGVKGRRSYERQG